MLRFLNHVSQYSEVSENTIPLAVVQRPLQALFSRQPLLRWPSSLSRTLTVRFFYSFAASIISVVYHESAENQIAGEFFPLFSSKSLSISLSTPFNLQYFWIVKPLRQLCLPIITSFAFQAVLLSFGFAEEHRTQTTSNSDGGWLGACWYKGWRLPKYGLKGFSCFQSGVES